MRRFLDSVFEAGMGLVARPVRSIGTLGAVGLGVAVMLTTVGFSQSSSRALLEKLGSNKAELFRVEYATSWGSAEGSSGIGNELGFIGSEEVDRIEKLPWVIETIRLSELVPENGALISREGYGPAGVRPTAVGLFAWSGEQLKMAPIVTTLGRVFDEGHSQRRERVTVLNSMVAYRLGITVVDGRTAVVIGEEPFVVIGVFDSPPAMSFLNWGVLIPEGTAEEIYRTDSGPDRMVLSTGDSSGRFDAPTDGLIVIGTSGSFSAIQKGIPLILAPNATESVIVRSPGGISLAQVRDVVESSLNTFQMILLVVVLAGAGLAVANAMLQSVRERTREIGLKAALGATRRDIASQFFIESVVVSVIGAVTGATAAQWILIIGTSQRGWLPILSRNQILLGLAVGVAVGSLAGVYPAWKASRLEPSEALRQI